MIITAGTGSFSIFVITCRPTDLSQAVPYLPVSCSDTDSSWRNQKVRQGLGHTANTLGGVSCWEQVFAMRMSAKDGHMLLEECNGIKRVSQEGAMQQNLQPKQQEAWN